MYKKYILSYCDYERIENFRISIIMIKNVRY